MRLCVIETAALADLGQVILREGPHEDADVADALRAELWARGTTTRHALVARVVASLGPIRTLESERVRTLLDTMARAGDVTAGPAGWLAPAPLRVVTLPDATCLLAGGAGSAVLRDALGADIEGAVPRRLAVPPPDLAERVERLGGLLMGPERWAGLIRTPPADAEWLASLDTRLSAEGSGSAGEPGASDWRAYVPDAAEPDERRRWRRSVEEARLWRAWQERGGWRYAWTAGASPEDGTALVLWSDDAHRTRFALARGAGAPVQAFATRHADSVQLRLDSPLPIAEYRYVLTIGVRAGSGYRIPDGSWAAAPETLERRLGLVIGMEASG